jgi:hypothetical protein
VGLEPSGEVGATPGDLSVEAAAQLGADVGLGSDGALALGVETAVAEPGVDLVDVGSLVLDLDGTFDRELSLAVGDDLADVALERDRGRPATKPARPNGPHGGHHGASPQL